MKQSLLWLLPILAVVALPAQTEELGSLPNTITIYTQFAHPPAAQSIDHMKAELDAIMAALDLRFDWRLLEEADGHQVMSELVVVRFRGACQADSLPTMESKSGPLGWTHIANGEVLPFVDVDCDRIRDLMAAPLIRAVPAERLRLLGRAMARVTAHELFHFLTNTTKHSANGITKAAYSASELASASMRFDEAELNLVREGRLHLANPAQYGSR